MDGLAVVCTKTSINMHGVIDGTATKHVIYIYYIARLWRHVCSYCQSNSPSAQHRPPYSLSFHGTVLEEKYMIL